MRQGSVLLSMVLLSIGVRAHGAEPAAGEVLACMRANVPAAVSVQQIELTASDRQGAESKLRGRLYATREKEAGGSRGLMHAMLRIDEPDHLSGAAYLVRETDDYLRDGMYVYLPSIRRVRRVTGTFADASLLGTSFSYYDFKQISSAFGDLDPRSEPNQRIGERAVHVLRFSPLEGVESRYSLVRAWVDEKTCVPLRVEFYEGEKLRKQMSVAPAALVENGGRWYASEVEMQDLVEHTKTTLRVVDVRVADDLPSRHFDPNRFFLGG